MPTTQLTEYCPLGRCKVLRESADMSAPSADVAAQDLERNPLVGKALTGSATPDELKQAIALVIDADGVDSARRGKLLADITAVYMSQQAKHAQQARDGGQNDLPVDLPSMESRAMSETTTLVENITGRIDRRQRPDVRSFLERVQEKPITGPTSLRGQCDAPRPTREERELQESIATVHRQTAADVREFASRIRYGN